MAFSAVLRTVGVVVSTADKRDLNQRRGGLLNGATVYRITRFFDGSNVRKIFTTEDTEITEITEENKGTRSSVKPCVLCV